MLLSRTDSRRLHSQSACLSRTRTGERLRKRKIHARIVQSSTKEIHTFGAGLSIRVIWLFLILRTGATNATNSDATATSKSQGKLNKPCTPYLKVLAALGVLAWCSPRSKGGNMTLDSNQREHCLQLEKHRADEGHCITLGKYHPGERDRSRAWKHASLARNNFCGLHNL